MLSCWYLVHGTDSKCLWHCYYPSGPFLWLSWVSSHSNLSTVLLFAEFDSDRDCAHISLFPVHSLQFSLVTRGNRTVHASYYGMSIGLFRYKELYRGMLWGECRKAGFQKVSKDLVVGLRTVLPHAFRGSSPVTVPKLHSLALLDKRSYSVLSVGHHSLCRNSDHRQGKCQAPDRQQKLKV